MSNSLNETSILQNVCVSWSLDLFILFSWESLWENCCLG